MGSIFEKYNFNESNGDNNLTFEMMKLSESQKTQIKVLVTKIETLLEGADTDFLDLTFYTIFEIDENNNEISSNFTNANYLNKTLKTLKTILENHCFDYKGLENTNRGKALIYDLLTFPSDCVENFYKIFSSK